MGDSNSGTPAVAAGSETSDPLAGAPQTLAVTADDEEMDEPIRATPEQLLAQLRKKQRSEAALRTAAQTYEAKLKDQEAAIAALQKADADRKAKDQTELERAQGQAAALQAALEKANAQREEAERTLLQVRALADVQDDATVMGFHNPRAAYQMIRDRITFDTVGEPENIPALLKELAKSDPYMVKSATPKPATPSVGSPAQPASTQRGKALISREDYARLPFAERRRLREAGEITHLLAGESS